MKSGRYCVKKRTSWLEYRIIRLPGNLSLKYRFVMCLHDRIQLVIRYCSLNSSKAMEVTKCLLSWNASLFYLQFLSILTKYQSFLVDYLYCGERSKKWDMPKIICPQIKNWFIFARENSSSDGQLVWVLTKLGRIWVHIKSWWGLRRKRDLTSEWPFVASLRAMLHLRVSWFLWA